MITLEKNGNPTHNMFKSTFEANKNETKSSPNPYVLSYNFIVSGYLLKLNVLRQYSPNKNKMQLLKLFL